ncbi:hypothetical protein D1114_20740 [Cereibacter sphaeroides]|uniref:Uncharacterized protein n=1 Tax=Cereibacter sphaeroides TaxID=1063 RepID=A0AAX1UGE4_CERSP|nr:hypothetical protein [Cereibacter sphaeroides]RDS93386.1 hypothetical protein DWF04_23190 [Cereibacter sphaeroides f. sp. denitrificans]RHZ91188.1 hypothetical protein D1114_20740 [Cereibacter sphaeroides]
MERPGGADRNNEGGATWAATLVTVTISADMGRDFRHVRVERGVRGGNAEAAENILGRQHKRFAVPQAVELSFAQGHQG